MGDAVRGLQAGRPDDMLCSCSASPEHVCILCVDMYMPQAVRTVERCCTWLRHRIKAFDWQPATASPGHKPVGQSPRQQAGRLHSIHGGLEQL
jgi:hypothetical protein